ncbi:hypothetical protein AK812_SmicGene24872 [Symbiodinium microadriaticum]|uniref:WW domain-containing protein n=1 Tax=Symbiodinium microadriaticum TaxID=2951 RepID=A0A1Q9DDE0_SYMMI|nr:hypothetical protein AK812_SmicGene24872 [Symbiodinium microadriaticum]
MEVIDDADVCSSGSEAVAGPSEEQVVEEENQEHAKEHASKNADQKSSRHKRDALREKSRQKRVHAQLEAKLQTMPLPPGWVRVASKSKPGAFYYAHPATKRTQAHPPATMYEGLPEPSKVLTPDDDDKTAVIIAGHHDGGDDGGGGGAAAGVDVDSDETDDCDGNAADHAKNHGRPLDIVQDAADAARKAEAKKKEREAEEEKARLAAKEEAARMRRKRDEEAAADEEVIRKAREKRALAPKESFEEAQAPERKEKRKATGVRFDTAKGAQDENGSPLAGSDSEELDLYRLRDQFRAKVAATSAPVFDDLEEEAAEAAPPPPPPPLPPPLPPPEMPPEKTKKEKKQEKKAKQKAWLAGKKALDGGCLEEAEEGCNGGCLDGGNCVEEERKQFKKLKKSLFQMMQKLQAKVAKAEKAELEDQAWRQPFQLVILIQLLQLARRVLVLHPQVILDIGPNADAATAIAIETECFMGVSLTVAFKTSLNDNEDEHQDHGILREPQIRRKNLERDLAVQDLWLRSGLKVTSYTGKVYILLTADPSQMKESVPAVPETIPSVNKSFLPLHEQDEPLPACAI